ncbi:hypothetical protein VPHD148_0277 [Vibrio phage D148]
MSEFTLDSLLSSLSDSTAETEMEKAASVETEVSIADQLKDTLTKEASDASTIGEDNMSVETGNAIADSILAMLDNGMNKEASEVGEPTPGNNVKVETDKMEQQHAERITSTPREGKTVTEVATALAAKTKGGTDAVPGADKNASPEGNSEAAVAAKPSDIEKSASVAELIDAGNSFEDAVEMVKEASAEIEAELHELEKVAAVDALMAQGLGFEESFELVKEASAQLLESESEYSDLEKSAAVQELMAEDGLGFEEAFELVKEAAAAGK